MCNLYLIIHQIAAGKLGFLKLVLCINCVCFCVCVHVVKIVKTSCVQKNKNLREGRAELEEDFKKVRTSSDKINKH